MDRHLEEKYTKIAWNDLDNGHSSSEFTVKFDALGYSGL